MRIRRLFLFAAFVTLLVLAVFHYAVSVLGLYETAPWADIVSHFLGGVVVGFAVLWILYFFGGAERSGMYTFVFVIAVFGAVGGLWEVFEYAAGFPQLVDNYAHDTVLDLIVGFFGAFGAWLAARTFVLV